MKKDEFATINHTKKRGNTFIIIVAIVAISLAGVLCAWKLHQESSSIFFNGNTADVSQLAEHVV